MPTSPSYGHLPLYITQLDSCYEIDSLISKRVDKSRVIEQLYATYSTHKYPLRLLSSCSPYHHDPDDRIDIEIIVHVDKYKIAEG